MGMNFAFVPLGTGSEVSKRAEEQALGWYRIEQTRAKAAPLGAPLNLFFILNLFF